MTLDDIPALKMHPTKNMLDYMTEMNRLFPRSIVNDNFMPPTPMNQFFNQSMARSSSSTDTSPESFPDMIGYRYPPEQHLQSPSRPDQSPAKPDYVARPEQRMDFPYNPFEPILPQQMYETPLVERRQRPIVGRKLITENLRHDEISNVWTDDSHTPPKAVPQIYELFPSGGKEIQNEFRTTRTSSHMSPKPSNIFPKTTNESPYASSMSQWTNSISEVSGLSTTPPAYYPTSPGSSRSSHSAFPPRFSVKEPIVGPSTSFCSTGTSKMCTFCRKNGETPLVYMTHTVKEKIGGKNIVSCPILRSHVCSTCGVSGDNAHTISYCPVLRSTNNGKPLQSTTITLKNTRVKSNGRRRF